MYRLVGILLLVASAVSFGAMAIFARLAYASGATPITVLSLRFAMASAIMLALVAVRRIRLPRGKMLLGLIAMGAVGYVGQSLTYFIALTLAPAGLVALLTYIYPVLVTVLATLLLKEHLTSARLVALLLAIAGAALTIGPTRGGQPLGIILSLVAATMYAGYILVSSRLLDQVPAIPASTVMITATALVYAGLLALEGPHLPATVEGWLAILALAVVSTVLAIGTFLAGLKRVGPTTAAMVTTMEPAIAVGLAALLLGERIGWLAFLGGALILIAVLIVTIEGRSASASQSTVGAAGE